VVAASAASVPPTAAVPPAAALAVESVQLDSATVARGLTNQALPSALEVTGTVGSSMPSAAVVAPPALKPSMVEAGLDGQRRRGDSAGELSTPVEDSIRHARLAARATASRLYNKPYDASIEEIAHRAIGEGPGALAEAADVSLGGASARLENLARAELRAGEAPLKRVEPALIPADRGDPLRESAPLNVLEADSGAPLQPSSGRVIARDPFANDAEASVDSDSGHAGVGAAVAQPVQSADPEAGLKNDGASRSVADESAAGEPELQVARLLGPAEDRLPLGKSVLVLAGDTVWDIAVAHYGSAGPLTLETILKSNPGIRDPRRLAVGAHIFLPFRSAEQMVGVDRDGSYRVLLAAAPRLDRLEAVRSWVGKVASGVELGTSTVHGVQTEYRLFAIGLANREDALNLAARLLAEYSRASGRRSGTV